MNKLILLCLSALALLQCAFAADCTAKVTAVEAPGHWNEHHRNKRVMDVQIYNDNARCTFSKSVTLNIQVPTGDILGDSWGMTGNVVTLPTTTTVAPGKTYAGVGFAYAGEGQPVITATAFGDCACDLDPQNPDLPTTAPTAAPTPTPAFPPTPAPGDIISLGLKFAIFSCGNSSEAGGDIRVPVVKAVLDSTGSPYSLFDKDAWGTTAPLILEDSNGNGLYYALVSTYDIGCWSTAQQTQIKEYQKKNMVKLVILYTPPVITNGVQSLGTYSVDQTDHSAYLHFHDNLLPSAGPVVHTAHMDLAGIYLHKAKIVSESIATPALLVNIGGEDFIAGSFVNLDGRKVLEFYMSSATWALFPSVLGITWVNWATNGVFAGSRRVEFNAHMDDIFMNTGTFSEDIGAEDDDDVYRITPDDLQKTLDWQNALNERLTDGSNVVLTFPYNGKTVEEKGGFLGDALFLKAKALREHFIWESHTYTHPYLTNYTWQNVTDEYTKNIKALAKLFDVEETHEAINKIPQYTATATITPSITGLFNGDALQAMWDFGIRFVVGDNSIPALCPANLYYILHSTEEDNGFAGMNIVPRHATNIYYDGSLPEHIESQFNYRYKQFGHLTFDDIVQRDVAVAVKALVAFRHDPFMFHQANLRSFQIDNKDHSLLSYWVDEVLDELERYISLPVISRHHEELGEVFLQREIRDLCGFEGTLKVDSTTGDFVGLSAKTQKDCRYGISGVEVADEDVENYGEEVTTWLDMKASTPVDVWFHKHIPSL